jgi:hypothetical protein
MQKLLLLLGLAILAFPSCTQRFGKEPQIVEPAPRPSYIVVPKDINAEYEVIGQVRLSSERAANVSDLYQKLGNECAKMGGDMIINVEAGDQSQDTSKIHSLPARPTDNPRFSPEMDIPYTWGTGTIIRLKDEEKRKAYQEEMQEGDLEGACAIIGVPPAR